MLALSTHGLDDQKDSGVRALKLSEAIRLGDAYSPQLTDGRYYDPETHATCGMACPALAAGFDFTPNEHGKFAFRIRPFLHERFPILEQTYNVLLACPVKQCPTMGPLIFHLAHLNDWHKWPREAIAKWVEGIEAAREAGTREDAPQLVDAR